MLACAVASGMYLNLPVKWFLTTPPSLLKLFAQSIYLEITNSILIAFPIILGSRLVLCIRNFYADPSEEDSNPIQGTPTQSHSFQSFTQPSLSVPFYNSQIEALIISNKGYHLNTNGDIIV